MQPDPQLGILLGHSAVPANLKLAVSKSPGARFYRCALQINPFDYLGRHNKQSEYGDEASYNQAMVANCRSNGIEVAAVTDHFRIGPSESLIAALELANIIVFPGFEASSSEGVHMLCLFGPGTPLDEIERQIGNCGVTSLDDPSPQSDKTFETLVEQITSAGGLVIAAHACATNGLLTTLQRQARARAWKHKALLAVGLPGPRDEVQENYRQILRNTDAATKRPRPIAVLNCNDVSDPVALNSSSTSTFIKMSEVTIEGLRQAFLDWESRIRLNSEADAADHIEMIAIAWIGGLLDGESLRLNSGLNVLVGGRGAGKSTLIESLRFAFGMEARGAETKQSHQSILRDVLGPGASVSVLLRLPHPSPQYYLVERLYGSRPYVRDQNGDILTVAPADLLNGLEIYGQHEISELTRQPAALAEILRRFVGSDADTAAQKEEVVVELERSSERITSEMAEIERLEDSLAALPSLREKLRRFAEAGLADRLSAKTQINDEARLFNRANAELEKLEELCASLEGSDIGANPIVDSEAEKPLPHADQLVALNTVQNEIAHSVARAASYLKARGKRHKAAIDAVEAQWEPSKVDANAEYERTLKELRAEGHDGSEYISTQEQVELLKPKEREVANRSEQVNALFTERQELLLRWEKLKAQDFNDLTSAARKVSRQLAEIVRVTVRQGSELTGLVTTLRQYCPGNISQGIERLKLHNDLSLSQLAADIRSGAAALVERYGFSQATAEKIAQGGGKLALAVEEAEIETEAIVELNVSAQDQPIWKALDQLSTGQKATAVLLLLLLQSEAPLIVDQPEDDLDNRFIAGHVVETIRTEKRNRQFLFSSHNANIPVLGDAEQIVGLTSSVEAGVERTSVPDECCGSIDKQSVKELVKDLLEGGQSAFEQRRRKYGF